MATLTQEQKRERRVRERPANALEKVPTGIRGLDQVTHGGLPKGRTALVCGGPGTGKTLLGLEFLVRGAELYSEPGVCVAFEETVQELTTNMASLGHNLNSLVKTKKLAIDYVEIERKQIEETGEYNLDGLFVRLKQAIDEVKAKRVLLDTAELLFLGLKNEGIVRSELRRLFHWLKDAGVTAVVTAESGENALTRHGLEEYVADCVILLDHRVTEQISTRRLRVVKYRGSSHGTNEYPFLMESDGIAVMPITSAGLSHGASTETISSGVDGLDEMLGRQGFFRGSSILITGTAGTGKSSFAASFARCTCERGERALYFSFEESPSQILRNMSSVGLDLHRYINKGLLKIHSSRPTTTGLEAHLAQMYKEVEDCAPDVVIIDPITNLIAIGDQTSVKGMLTRLIDFLKMKNITALFTNLIFGDEMEERAIGISSLMDGWLVLRDIPHGAERIRTLNLLKCRGMAHDMRVHSFTLGEKGITINGNFQTIGALQAQ